MTSQPSGRFGSAIAVLDFNVDGVPDVVVGAPSVGSQHLTYTVRVLYLKQRLFIFQIIALKRESLILLKVNKVDGILLVVPIWILFYKH